MILSVIQSKVLMVSKSSIQIWVTRTEHKLYRSPAPERRLGIHVGEPAFSRAPATSPGHAGVERCRRNETLAKIRRPRQPRRSIPRPSRIWKWLASEKTLCYRSKEL